jgi:rubrerythrin
MDNTEIINQLKKLVQLDIDAIHAYTHAIDHIDIQDVKNRLAEFRGDHQRHVDDLSAVIRRYGDTPPELKQDFKGYLIQGMTSLRSVSGTAGALKAMKSNEELTNKTYDQAVAIGFPPDVQSIVARNRDDERRHLDYISRCIEDEVWEQGPKVA